MKRGASVATVLGGLLIALSFIGPALGFTFPSFFPGVALLFVSRALNRAGKLRGPLPEPVVRQRPPQRQPQPNPTPPEPVQHLSSGRLEEILGELDAEPEPEPPADLGKPIEVDSGTPLSSQEMISRARSRWDPTS